MLDTIFPFLRSRLGLIVIQRAHQNSNSPEFSVYKIPRFPDEFLVDYRYAVAELVPQLPGNRETHF